MVKIVSNLSKIVSVLCKIKVHIVKCSLDYLKNCLLCVVGLENWTRHFKMKKMYKTFIQKTDGK